MRPNYGDESEEDHGDNKDRTAFFFSPSGGQNVMRASGALSVQWPESVSGILKKNVTRATFKGKITKNPTNKKNKKRNLIVK